MFDRFINLIGEDNFNIIKNTKVLLVGVGGVGSYALEALVRNGFKDITIIDQDIIDITNLNRQLYTNQDNIGNIKVEEAKKRALSINPDVLITCYFKSLNDNNMDYLMSDHFDYVIDACDTVDTKVLLMKYANIYNYKLISSMGTAKKMDPTALCITTLDKTKNDPLARIIRKKVKSMKINSKVNVVSSTELPKNISSLGSNNLVPSVAGLLCVSFIINDILK